MKVKIISNTRGDDLEEEINKFIEGKDVVSIKFEISQYGLYTLIMYKE